jgi:hypothetical protein
MAERSPLALADDRLGRTIVRVTLRQLRALQSRSPVLAAWLADYDRASPADIEDPMEALH